MNKYKISKSFILFMKGIVVGFGGIAPGLSGSVLLIIFGLYQKTLDCLGTIFTNFKGKIKFLCPLLLGMGIGVLLFSKLVNYLLNYYEMPTRYAFFGLILGTIPMLHQNMKKDGYSNKYYLVVLCSLFIGIWMFNLSDVHFVQLTKANLIQSIILGIAVAATAIIPGLDPAVFLSSIGYYQLYVESLANMNLQVLLPMLIGLGIGSIMISYGMTYLFNKCYTFVYSIIFGIFLSMIPNMLNSSCMLGFNGQSLLSMIIMILGIMISYYFSIIEGK